MALPDLELIITRTPGGAATAALRVELPSRRADLVEDVPVTLHDEALRGLLHIPNAYAGALTGMIFVPQLREAWQRALGYVEGAGELLRVRLDLRGDDSLHALCWELLRDPVTNTPLAYRERVAFSRFLSSTFLGDVQAPTKPRLRAVVAVSSAAGPGMAPVDVAGEVARAVAALGDVPATVLDGRAGRPAASLPALADALRAGPQLLVLTCHGTLLDRPSLYLERLPGEPDLPIPGDELVRQIADLPARPLLVVLASCHGAGDTYATLAAVGPQLARVGVGAVLAMQGEVPMELVAALLPRLLTELDRDGQIDRALAAARAALPADQPWWLPTLWMAVKDGALWREDTPPPAPMPAQTGDIHIGGAVGTVQVIHMTGGSVGSIIGSQATYGAPPAPDAAHDGADPTEGLLRRLAQHRATLDHYLGQVAQLGSAYAPPGITAGIRESRQEIWRIKARLRTTGQVVEDYLDDEEA